MPVPDLRINKIKTLLEEYNTPLLMVGSVGAGLYEPDPRTEGTQKVCKNGTFVGYIVYRVNYPGSRDFAKLSHISIKNISFVTVFDLKPVPDDVYEAVDWLLEHIKLLR